MPYNEDLSSRLEMGCKIEATVGRLPQHGCSERFKDLGKSDTQRCLAFSPCLPRLLMQTVMSIQTHHSVYDAQAEAEESPACSDEGASATDSWEGHVCTRQGRSVVEAE